MQREKFGLIGTLCPHYSAQLSALKTVAPTRLSILITGETGTGKELIARAIHEESGKTGSFVAINCAALPANLIESELFGHVKGAFSGADRDRPGALVASSGGTLFLDEIGDAPVAVQVALLRALESQRVKPVGAEAEVEADLRIVTATSRDLLAMMKDSSFRPDLYYRLTGHRVKVPALRERLCDLPSLATELSIRMGHEWGLTCEALAKLSDYGWPGNIRELKHAVERAAAHTPAGQSIAAVEAGEGGPVSSVSLRKDALRSLLSPEVRIQADIWKQSGLLLLPPNISRRGARTLERRLLLCLLVDIGFDACSAEMQHRAGRLFGAGWSRSESGRSVTHLASVLLMKVETAELVALVDWAMRSDRAQEVTGVPGLCEVGEMG